MNMKAFWGLFVEGLGPDYVTYVLGIGMILQLKTFRNAKYERPSCSMPKMLGV